MPTPLNRRELLTLAAAAGAAAMALPAMAQTASSSPPSTPAAAEAAVPDTTQEGVALVSAAYASAGYTIPDDQIAEIRKQLSGYPGDFAKARKFGVENGDAPTMNVTAALPARPTGKPVKKKMFGLPI